jgi:hypothetical protein
MQAAKKIIRSFLDEYGSESAYLAGEGQLLSKKQIRKYVQDYLYQLGLQNMVVVNFIYGQVAPTSVTYDAKTGICKLNIKLPCTYRAAKIMGVLDHEIGTHYLRKFNESQQKWYKKKDFYNMGTCIATEEGLASIHGNIQTVLDNKSKPFLFS